MYTVEKVSMVLGIKKNHTYMCKSMISFLRTLAVICSIVGVCCFFLLSSLVFSSVSLHDHFFLFIVNLSLCFFFLYTLTILVVSISLDLCKCLTEIFLFLRWKYKIKKKSEYKWIRTHRMCWTYSMMSSWCGLNVPTSFRLHHNISQKLYTLIVSANVPDHCDSTSLIPNEKKVMRFSLQPIITHESPDTH